MKATGFTGPTTSDSNGSFIDFTLDTPHPTGHDILVKIKAVSVNPVDFKVRRRISEEQHPARILGWDAAGIVEEVGELVTLFKPGDRVYYAGDITRAGSNASHQLVDERLVGHMPATLDFPAAAALPLTSITAWEALFDRLKIGINEQGKTILIIGAAGGVGSIAIQLAKQVAGLNVIATASRPETRDWCLSLGADHVINHYVDMLQQFSSHQLTAPDYIFCLQNTDQYFETMAELIAPQGTICTIVEVNHPNLDLLKSKSAGLVWEFMFTRAMYQTTDMVKQYELLTEISQLIDQQKLKSTLQHDFGMLSAASLTEAHQLLESGKAIGKIVMGIS